MASHRNFLFFLISLLCSKTIHVFLCIIQFEFLCLLFVKSNKKILKMQIFKDRFDKENERILALCNLYAMQDFYFQLSNNYCVKTANLNILNQKGKKFKLE